MRIRTSSLNRERYLRTVERDIYVQDDLLIFLHLLKIASNAAIRTECGRHCERAHQQDVP